MLSSTLCFPKLYVVKVPSRLSILNIKKPRSDTKIFSNSPLPFGVSIIGLLFSQERSAGLGQDQTTLGGGAGPGQNTLS